MSEELDDIPGTLVFDGRRSRQGYRLNKLCMSLNEEENRAQFRQDEAAYCDRFGLTPDQKEAVLARDWLRMLELGGNIYFTYKLALVDGLSMQAIGGAMSGMTEDEFKAMMQAGGRKPDAS